jgi:hypothetical protein
MAELVTSEGVRYNSEAVIWMTNAGGTVYLEGEIFDVTPLPIIPTVQVVP